MVSNIVVLAYSLVFATGKISTFIAFFIEFNQIRVETGNTMPLFFGVLSCYGEHGKREPSQPKFWMC